MRAITRRRAGIRRPTWVFGYDDGFCSISATDGVQGCEIRSGQIGWDTEISWRGMEARNTLAESSLGVNYRFGSARLGVLSGSTSQYTRSHLPLWAATEFRVLRGRLAVITLAVLRRLGGGVSPGVSWAAEIAMGDAEGGGLEYGDWC